MASHEEEVLRLAKAALESVRPLRETQTNDGNDESTPLVTGTVPPQEVAGCLFNHPEIDHGLRQGIMWMPRGNELLAWIMTFDESGEREVVQRIAYSKVAA